MINQTLMYNGILVIIAAIISTWSMITNRNLGMSENEESSKTNYFKTINSMKNIPINILMFVIGGLLIYHGLAPKYGWPILWGF